METALLYVAGAVLLGLAGVGVGVGVAVNSPFVSSNHRPNPKRIHYFSLIYFTSPSPTFLSLLSIHPKPTSPTFFDLR